MKRKIFKGLIFVTILVLIGYFFILILFPEVYLNHLYQVMIYDHENNIAYSLIQSTITDYTKIDEVSEEFKTTLVTIEDKRFYSHNGLDYSRILKSLVTNAKNNEITQGGSTITQQLARMSYLDNSKTYSRKIKEALYAKKIEEKYTKDQILEMYINNCYFAHNLYGIRSASEYYFDKLPSELNYSESALLVGIINAPNIYATDIDYEKSIQKQQQILSTLYENNILDTKTYYEELNRPINLTLNNNYIDSNLMYYHEGITNQLKQLNLDKKKYLRQGLAIKSCFDNEVHNKVNKIVKKYQNSSKNDEIAVVVMKPYSSEVLTLIGGFDYSNSQYNRALYSKRQIGSTIKPFLYYLGLEEGMTPLTKFTSEPTTFNIEGVGLYSPKNAGDNYAKRKINMVEAISLSDNIYAMKTTLMIGSSKIQTLLNKFDIDCGPVNPTIGLGSISLTPLELTSLYNCLASEGTYYSPSFIKQINLSDSTLLKKVSEKKKIVLNSKNTIIINHLLKSPFDTALSSYTYPSLGKYQTNNTFGGKTGSTDSTNWVVGFNPKYTIGVYVGNDDNQNINDTKLARKMFQEIANSLTENQKDIYYQTPDSLKSFTLYNSLINKKSKVYYY